MTFFPHYLFLLRRSSSISCKGQVWRINGMVHQIWTSQATLRNLKMGLTKNKTRQIFRKKEHFFPPDTHTHMCVSGSKKCLLFGNFHTFIRFLEALRECSKPTLPLKRLKTFKYLKGCLSETIFSSIAE